MWHGMCFSFVDGARHLGPSQLVDLNAHTTKSMLTRWLQALTSERGHLTVFVVLWSAVVVLPILGVVMFSFLAGHGLQINGN